jgi:hypothetical protein
MINREANITTRGGEFIHLFYSKDDENSITIASGILKVLATYLPWSRLQSGEYEYFFPFEEVEDEIE